MVTSLLVGLEDQAKVCCVGVESMLLIKLQETLQKLKLWCHLDLPSCHKCGVLKPPAKPMSHPKKRGKISGGDHQVLEEKDSHDSWEGGIEELSVRFPSEGKLQLFSPGSVEMECA